MKIKFIYPVLVCLLLGCSRFEPSAPLDNELLDGPVSDLTSAQNQQFLAGDRAFNDEIFTPSTGLGPVFVASSCGSCHAGDGKGHPFIMLTRFGQIDSTGNLYSGKGGPQLQHRAVPGFLPEQLPAGVKAANFLAPSNTGLGYLEAVTDSALLSMADPDDLNGDGISGVPNWNSVPYYVQPKSGGRSRNGKFIGRFGKKASVHNLLQQTANAYNQDMGVTSSFEPYDPYSQKEVEPEVSANTILDVVFYLETLKAPIPRNQQDASVNLGKQLFVQVGCESCHKQTLQTGESPVSALNRVDFHPYTDLLLHDMGPGLDDGYTEGSATTAEWRTAPLWGLGLSEKSQGGQYFLMHDGRAKSIEAAIQMHGGEAAASAAHFSELPPVSRNALVIFLKSL